MVGNGELESIPKLGFQVESDGDDKKHLSKYSAILVASIQEAKERLSQIEYVFCNQLYSHVHSQYNKISKAKKEAEHLWKNKEKEFLFQIENFKLENQQLLVENRCLKLEKESMSSLKERNQQIRIDELEQEVRIKSKEVDEGMELQNRLLQLVQTKSSMALERGKQLKEREDKINDLLAKVNSFEKEVEELKKEVNRKKQEVPEKKELAPGLHKHIVSLLNKLADNEDSLSALEKEEDWEWKMELLEDKVGELQKKLGKKMEEVEEGRVLQAEFIQQIDMDQLEILKQKQQLEESENEKNLLMEKVCALQETIDELKELLCRSTRVAEGKDLEEKLLQQIEMKVSQLTALNKSHRDLYDKYKSLKSQYNYLCNKTGLTEENMLQRIKVEDGSGSLQYQQNQQTSPDFERKHVDTSAAAISEMKKVKIENDGSDGLEDDKLIKVIPMSSFHSPTSSHIVPKCPPLAKSAPVIGAKRPASRWIETRSRQCRDGPDPHDDFLDTPLENRRGNLNKAAKEKAHDLQIPVQKNLQPDSSDDETQDMNVDPGPEKQQIPLPLAGQKAFKYVEPVRKKAERENLQGVECKQCKKFYDAVLPDGGKDADGNNQNFRCEHHDGVSRHRYKYIPPMTPEGFWNIGFESEM